MVTVVEETVFLWSIREEFGTDKPPFSGRNLLKSGKSGSYLKKHPYNTPHFRKSL